MRKKISLYIQSAFYLFGGVNHFINPQFYLDLIPDYLPMHKAINLMAGVVEVVFGAGLLFSVSRKYAAYGIMLMLVAFIPSHIYFIEIGGCIQEGLCAPEWVGWIRLVVIHPLLIWWAYSIRNV